MDIELWDINKLKPYENNPRRNDDAVDAVAESIRSFGFRQPIVVTRDGLIVAGHTRYKAALKLGLKQVPVHVAADLTPEQIKAYRIADNQTASIADWDRHLLCIELSELQTADYDLTSLGFSQTMLSTLLQPIEDRVKYQAKVKTIYAVLARCRTEVEQRDLLDELSQRGLQPRALILDMPVTEKKSSRNVSIDIDGHEIVREIDVNRTPRVMQLEGLFDLPIKSRLRETWRINLKLDKPWNIGLIVGSSGSGKTTIAKELFGDAIVSSWPWSKDKAIIDDFPQHMSITEIVDLLSRVGFSSPPCWLKPYHVLSNGEQFRVHVARTLAEKPELAVIDEFSSVVDRQVAQIASSAVAKAVRATGRKLIAISCHYDIEDWLQPDWKLEMPQGTLTWRFLQRRPGIKLHIRPCDKSFWAIFSRYHYLSNKLHGMAQCFLGEANGLPAAFMAVIKRTISSKRAYYAHRVVCHPDFQGVGIGNAMCDLVASAYACLLPFKLITSHPAFIWAKMRSPHWRCYRVPSLNYVRGKTQEKRVNWARIDNRYCLRLTAGFEYIGPLNIDLARTWKLC